MPGTTVERLSQSLLWDMFSMLDYQFFTLYYICSYLKNLILRRGALVRRSGLYFPHGLVKGGVSVLVVNGCSLPERVFKVSMQDFSHLTSS